MYIDTNGTNESIYAQYSIFGDSKAKCSPNLSPKSNPRYNVIKSGAVPKTMNLWLLSLNFSMLRYGYCR